MLAASPKTVYTKKNAMQEQLEQKRIAILANVLKISYFSNFTKTYDHVNLSHPSEPWKRLRQVKGPVLIKPMALVGKWRSNFVIFHMDNQLIVSSQLSKSPCFPLLICSASCYLLSFHIIGNTHAYVLTVHTPYSGFLSWLLPFQNFLIFQ